MASTQHKSTSVTVQDDQDDDEDVDDLDDVLENLDKPRPTRSPLPPPSTLASSNAQTSSTPTPPSVPSARNAEPGTAGGGGGGGGEDLDMSEADFEAELARGMQALFANLGGGSSAGPTLPSSTTNPTAPPPTTTTTTTTKLSEDQQVLAAKQLQEMFEKMMKGEDVDEDALDGFLGFGGSEEQDSVSLPGPPPNTEVPTHRPSESTTPIPTVGPSSSSGGGGAGGLSFDETIERTMKNLKSSAERAKTTTNTSSSSTTDPFSALLSQLSSLDPSTIDPSLLDAFNGGDGNGDIEGMLDGMMNQLMSREVLEEPLMELADKYPPYIQSHPSLPSTEKLKNTTQLNLILEILSLFKQDGYTDEPNEGDVIGKARKERVGVLMGQMQELGSPPEEVMGQMPEGFDFGGLGGGGENCTIM